MDQRETALTDLERRRAECVLLAKNEADPTAKAALLQRSASLTTDIQIAKRRKPDMPRGPAGAD
jgi:hypothetical protein